MEQSAGQADDPLAMLNAAEIEVLAYLAQGHTIKSIAGRTGRTEAWLNERLRDARRKTGEASSRELARRLRPNLPEPGMSGPDKIGAKEIDLSQVPARLSTDGGAGWLSRRRGLILGGSLTMMIIVLGAALALSLPPAQRLRVDQTPPQPLRAPTSDVVIVGREARTPYLVTIVLTLGDRRFPPRSIVATEREMAGFAVAGLQVHLVVMPTPVRATAVDVALSAELSDSAVRRLVSTTVTADDGAPFRVQLPARDGAPAGSIDVIVRRAVDELPGGG